MPCLNQSLRHNCVQGHQPCPTPWTCGAYSQQADYDTSPHRIQFYGPEPDEKAPTVTVFGWREMAASFCITAVVAIIVAWLCLSVWPVLTAALAGWKW